MADRHVLKQIGQRVAEHRRTRGLTQKQVAARLGVSRQSISQIENGIHDAGIAGLVELARVLSVPVSDLTDGIGPTRTAPTPDPDRSPT